MQLRALSVAITLAIGLVVPALGQGEPTPIGKMVRMKGSVSIEHTTAVVLQASTEGSKPKVGDAVYRGDVIQTGNDGAVGISFVDGSAFNLTSNARIILNEFEYDPNGTSNSIFFSLTKGAFALVAGEVARTGDM